MNKYEVVHKAQISIWLDNYDDIFSDFDSRPLEARALSDDFINEARKMAKEKPNGKIELKFLLPSKERDPATEMVIVDSLHKHFHRFAENNQMEINKLRKEGYLQCALGFIIMVVTAYLYIYVLSDKTFYWDALRVILEPSGWFFAWSGFENLFQSARKKKPELVFNASMAKSEITFFSL